MNGHTVVVELSEPSGKVALPGHGVQRPGRSEVSGLDDEDHGDDQDDQRDHSSDLAESIDGDRVEGVVSCSLESALSDLSVHEEGHEEVQCETDESAAEECLGGVVSGILVLGAVDSGGLPCAGGPLSESEASEDQHDGHHVRVSDDGEVPCVGDVGELEVSDVSDEDDYDRDE